MNMTDEPQVQEKEEGQQQKKAEEKSGINEEAERLEKATADFKEANAERKRILDREEKLIARKEALNALGGDSKKEEPPQPKEETAVEYQKRVMSGGLNAKPTEKEE